VDHFSVAEVESHVPQSRAGSRALGNGTYARTGYRGLVLAAALCAALFAGCIFNIVAARQISAALVDYWDGRPPLPLPLRFFLGPQSPMVIRVVGIAGLTFFGTLFAVALAQG
jgi:hypothetical protein